MIETIQRQTFADAADYEECRRLHRAYGTTYYFASRRFPKPIQKRVDALYGFVRVPDEWVDNPMGLSTAEQSARLNGWRSELLRGFDGICPDHPVMRAFTDVMAEVRMPIEEPLLFLDAMAQDLTVTRYATYGDLRGYMRGSASAVGVMMCAVLEADCRPETLQAAMALGEAMQLTNFLRDVAEDAVRGRIYLPVEDMDRFGVSEEQVMEGLCDECFVRLMQFEIGRARELYALADAGIPALPPHARKAVTLARILYARILDRIEARGCDVFRGRARTGKMEKLAVGVRVLIGA